MLTRHRWSRAILAFLTALMGSVQRLPGDEHPTRIDAFNLQSGDVVVFLGDELTKQAEFTQYLESFFLTRFPDYDLRIIKLGQAGTWLTNAAQAFFDPLEARRPSKVIVFPGVLGSGGGRELRDDLFQAFCRDIEELDGRVRELGAEPIYLSPLIFNSGFACPDLVERPPDARNFADADLVHYGTWLKKFAAESSAIYIDLQGPLHQWIQQFREHGPDLTRFPDGRHAPSCHLAIACTILEELGLASSLSTIEISLVEEELAVVAKNGQVLHAESESPESLTFLWLSDAIPWALPSELQSSAALPNIASRFNHEILRVAGLKEGRYQLLIDDRMIGKFTDAEFVDGIPLHDYVTPQSEQSRKISDGNHDRTKSYVRPAREISQLVFEQEMIVKDLGTLPMDDSLQERRMHAEKHLADLREQQRQLETAAAEAWNSLREDSLPIPRRIVIRPVPKVQVQGRVYVAGMPISGATVQLHGTQGLTAVGTTNAMGFFELTPKTTDEIAPGEAWLVVLSQMVLPKFVSLESSGHRIILRAGVNEIELYFEETPAGE